MKPAAAPTAAHKDSLGGDSVDPAMRAIPQRYFLRDLPQFASARLERPKVPL
jgi:hypothetical protein